MITMRELTSEELVIFWKEYFTESKAESEVINLFAVYGRLKKIPKLISLLIKFIVHESDTCIRAPNIIFDQFALYCLELPSSQSVGLWENLVQLISEKLTEILQNKNYTKDITVSIYIIKFFVELLLRLTMNTIVKDHNVQQIKSLLDELPHKCILPIFRLHELQPDNTSTACALSLTYVYGELMLLLQNYFNIGIHIQLKLGATACDLSSIHSYYSEWKELYSNLENWDDNCREVYCLLLLQKLRYIESIGANSEAEILCKQKIAKLLFKIEKKYESEKIWFLMVNNIAILITYCDDRIAKKAFKRILAFSLHGDFKTRTKEVIFGNKCLELHACQTMLVSAILENISELFEENEKSTNILKLLASEDEPWLAQSEGNAVEQNNAWKIISDSVGKLNIIMLTNNEVKVNISELYRVIQFLSMLPLQFMIPINQARCFIGILTILCSLHIASHPKLLPLVATCEEIMTILFEEYSIFRVSNFFKIGSLLRWYLKFQSKILKKMEKEKFKYDQMRLERFEESLLIFVLQFFKNLQQISDLDIFIEELRLIGNEEYWKSAISEERNNYLVAIKVVLKCIVEVDKRNLDTRTILLCNKYVTIFKETLLQCSNFVLRKDCLTAVRKILVENLLLVATAGKKLNIECLLDSKIEVENMLQEFLCSEDPVVYFAHANVIIEVFPKMFFKFWKKMYLAYINQDNDNENVNAKLARTNLDEEIKKLIASCSDLQLQEINTQLMHSLMAADISGQDAGHIKKLLELWMVMPFKTKNQEKLIILNQIGQQLLFMLPNLIRRINRNFLTDLTIAGTQLIANILQQKECTNPELAFHTFFEITAMSIPKSIEEFAEIFHGLYEIVNAMFINHSEIVPDKVAIIQTCLTSLLNSLLEKSDQYSADIDYDLPYLEEAARNLVRLFSQLNHWHKSFAYISHNIVAAFVRKLQQITILPSVKHIVTEGIFHVFDLCQPYSIELLRSNLPSNTKEIFKLLHLSYERKHKYRGRV